MANTAPCVTPSLRLTGVLKDGKLILLNIAKIPKMSFDK